MDVKRVLLGICLLNFFVSISYGLSTMIINLVNTSAIEKGANETSTQSPLTIKNLTITPKNESIFNVTLPANDEGDMTSLCHRKITKENLLKYISQCVLETLLNRAHNESSRFQNLTLFGLKDLENKTSLSNLTDGISQEETAENRFRFIYLPPLTAQHSFVTSEDDDKPSLIRHLKALPSNGSDAAQKVFITENSDRITQSRLFVNEPKAVPSLRHSKSRANIPRNDDFRDKSEQDVSQDVHTETDDGRFLPGDYRSMIEKEAEALIKQKKTENSDNTPHDSPQRDHSSQPPYDDDISHPPGTYNSEEDSPALLKDPESEHHEINSPVKSTDDFYHPEFVGYDGHVPGVQFENYYDPHRQPVQLHGSFYTDPEFAFRDEVVHGLQPEYVPYDGSLFEGNQDADLSGTYKPQTDDFSGYTDKNGCEFTGTCDGHPERIRNHEQFHSVTPDISQDGEYYFETYSPKRPENENPGDGDRPGHFRPNQFHDGGSFTDDNHDSVEADNIREKPFTQISDGSQTGDYSAEKSKNHERDSLEDKFVREEPFRPMITNHRKPFIGSGHYPVKHSHNDGNDRNITRGIRYHSKSPNHSDIGKYRSKTESDSMHGYNSQNGKLTNNDNFHPIQPNLNHSKGHRYQAEVHSKRGYGFGNGKLRPEDPTASRPPNLQQTKYVGIEQSPISETPEDNEHEDYGNRAIHHYLDDSEEDTRFQNNHHLDEPPYNSREVVENVGFDDTNSEEYEREKPQQDLYFPRDVSDHERHKGKMEDMYTGDRGPKYYNDHYDTKLNDEHNYPNSNGNHQNMNSTINNFSPVLNEGSDQKPDGKFYDMRSKKNHDHSITDDQNYNFKSDDAHYNPKLNNEYHDTKSEGKPYTDKSNHEHYGTKSTGERYEPKFNAEHYSNSYKHAPKSSLKDGNLFQKSRNPQTQQQNLRSRNNVIDQRNGTQHFRGPQFYKSEFRNHPVQDANYVSRLKESNLGLNHDQPSRKVIPINTVNLRPKQPRGRIPSPEVLSIYRKLIQMQNKTINYPVESRSPDSSSMNYTIEDESKSSSQEKDFDESFKDGVSSSEKNSEEYQNGGSVRNQPEMDVRAYSKFLKAGADGKFVEGRDYNWLKGFYQYLNVPHSDAFEYGYHLGDANQTLERHHQTDGPTSITRLVWADANGDSANQYWEFNHGHPEHDDDSTMKPSS